MRLTQAAGNSLSGSLPIKAARVQRGCSLPRRRSARIYACRDVDSCEPAAALLVESSQSSSCSASGPESQWSNKCAAFGKATWRDSEGKLEERQRGGAVALQKGSFDFAAP